MAIVKLEPPPSDINIGNLGDISKYFNNKFVANPIQDISI